MTFSAKQPNIISHFCALFTKRDFPFSEAEAFPGDLLYFFRKQLYNPIYEYE